MSRFAVAAALAAGCALAPPAVLAQKIEPLTYRCVGKDHKTYYGQTPPPQCAGLAIEMLNSQGLVVKRVDPKADAEKKAQKEADDAKKRQEDALMKEQQRRDKALLATYTSEADLEASRKRALAENEKAVREIDGRIAAIKKRQGELAQEMEFYQGKNKPPAKLARDVSVAKTDLEAQEGLRAQKAKEVDAINAKYDEEKRRYVELTRGSASK